jgi:hypothetical protein
VRRFPAEFADLLTARGRSLLRAREPLPQFRTDGRTGLAALRNVISRETAAGCVTVLDRTFYPLLDRMQCPIPPESITGMRTNYSEQLPKTARVKTVWIGTPRTRPWKVAREIGLTGMLASRSLRAFTEAVSGCRLGAGCGSQIICYEAGDYAGPHNDHHPEVANVRDGYVDVHIMFSNDAVQAQWLVYEQSGHLSEAVDVSMPGGVTIYRLPFWHYATPLLARAGREAEARRWLILASFELAREPVPAD